MQNDQTIIIMIIVYEFGNKRCPFYKVAWKHWKFILRVSFRFLTRALQGSLNWLQSEIPQRVKYIISRVPDNIIIVFLVQTKISSFVLLRDTEKTRESLNCYRVTIKIDSPPALWRNIKNRFLEDFQIKGWYLCKCLKL